MTRCLLCVTPLVLVRSGLLLAQSPGDSKTPPAKDANTLTNSLGLKFVRVPKGSFWMGAGGDAARSQASRDQSRFLHGRL